MAHLKKSNNTYDTVMKLVFRCGSVLTTFSLSFWHKDFLSNASRPWSLHWPNMIGTVRNVRRSSVSVGAEYLVQLWFLNFSFVDRSIKANEIFENVVATYGSMVYFNAIISGGKQCSLCQQKETDLVQANSDQIMVFSSKAVEC